MKWIIDLCDFETLWLFISIKKFLCMYWLFIILVVLLKIININEIESRQINGTALYDVKLNEINFDRVGLVASAEDKIQSSSTNGSVLFFSFEKFMRNTTHHNDFSNL